MNNDYTTINCLSKHDGKEVTLAGWLYKGRSSGKVQFLVIRDGTGLCQCIVEKSKVPEELFSQLKHLGQESSLSVTGTVRADDRSVGGYELAVTDAQIISPADGYPITPKSHGIFSAQAPPPALSLTAAVVHRKNSPHGHRCHPKIFQRQWFYPY